MTGWRRRGNSNKRDRRYLGPARFADELVDAGQLDLPGESGIRKAELDMAQALVNGLAGGWDPSRAA